MSIFTTTAIVTAATTTGVAGAFALSTLSIPLIMSTTATVVTGTGGGSIMATGAVGTTLGAIQAFSMANTLSMAAPLAPVMVILCYVWK